MNRCYICKDYFHDKFLNLISVSKFFKPIVYICDFCTLEKQFSSCQSCGTVYYGMNVSYYAEEDIMVCDDCVDAYGWETVKSKKHSEMKRNKSIEKFKSLMIEV